MNRAPSRSGRTPLSDAELYLFDALFDVIDRLGALRREEFAARNLPYTHDLDPAALDRAVRGLEQAGLVRLRPASRRPELGPWVQLTAAGGKLWELEREPDWAHFCQDSSAPEGHAGRWLLRIRSTDARVAEAFLETAITCGLYAGDVTRLGRGQVRSRVVPWQRRRALVELRLPLQEAEPTVRLVDWATYEARRTWWRSIPELATLVA
jgi:DNA-binding MarR family transcriptional regulator